MPEPSSRRVTPWIAAGSLLLLLFLSACASVAERVDTLLDPETHRIFYGIGRSQTDHLPYELVLDQTQYQLVLGPAVIQDMDPVEALLAQLGPCGFTQEPDYQNWFVRKDHAGGDLVRGVSIAPETGDALVSLYPKLGPREDYRLSLTVIPSDSQGRFVVLGRIVGHRTLTYDHSASGWKAYWPSEINPERLTAALDELAQGCAIA